MQRNMWIFAAVMSAGLLCGRRELPAQQNVGGPVTRQNAVYQGYSTVSLKDRAEWNQGDSRFYGTYDGRNYLFVSEEERRAFAANPERYIPVLGGECIVTLVEEKRRVQADLHYGVFYKDRFYFFENQVKRDRFRTNPSAYENADLANGGNCVVTQVEQQKLVPGRREYMVLHNNLRFLFTGPQQRQAFIDNRARYLSTGPAATPGGAGQISDNLLVGLDGYCPVTLRDLRQWTQGNPAISQKYDIRQYVFASKAEKETFDRNPGKYVPVLAGDCVVTLKQTGRRVPGTVDHAAYHMDRLFLFPDEAHKEEFKANPTLYSDVDLAYAGASAVFLKDNGQTVAGLPQYTVLHVGKRYQFTGVMDMNKFVQNMPKYEEPAGLSGQR